MLTVPLSCCDQLICQILSRYLHQLQRHVENGVVWHRCGHLTLEIVPFDKAHMSSFVSSIVTMPELCPYLTPFLGYSEI